MRRVLARAAATALLVAAAVLGTTATTDAAACPALEYQAGLASSAAALQQSPPDVATAQRLIHGLTAATPGSTVALQPVIADLSSIPADVGDAQLRLSSMSATLAYPHGSVCDENAAAARTALHDVYAAPDFRHLDEAPRQNPLASIFNAIANLIGRGAGALGPVGAVVLAAAVLALAIALAWRRWHGSAALRGARVD
ncbi:MAG: hypothetical protein M3Z57_03480, partial [Candidatus Dormibacteraeota bacterium]|nr:hypothetical protein [Candidatus Dormibacteraeota bacterium]